MPTVVIGNNTGNDYSGTEDAQIASGAPNNNYGGNVYDGLQTTKYDSSSHAHTLIKFSGLSNITGPVTVSAASLSLYQIYSGGSGTQTLSLKRLLRNWIEGTQTGFGADRQNDDPDSCCWNEYGSGNAWSTAGGLSDGNDRASSSSTTISSNTTNSEYKTSGDLSANVEDFINGDVSNYGWHIERTDGANDSTYRQFRCSEESDGVRPYLTITYTESGSGATAKSGTDSGVMTDNIAVNVDLDLLDSGIGAETILVKSKISINDTSNVIDNAIIKAYINQHDSIVCSDEIRSIKAIFKIEDSGLSIDNQKIYVKTIISESGSYIDTINSIKAYLRLDESGLSSDDLNIFAKLVIGETVNANEYATKGGNAYVALVESGVGVDSISVRALLNISDGGNGVDSNSEKMTLVISDDGVAVDNVSIRALLALVDSGVTVDDISYNNPKKIISDYGSFVDSVVVIGNGGFVEDIYFISAITKSVSFESPIQKILSYSSAIQKTLSYTVALQ